MDPTVNIRRAATRQIVRPKTSLIAAMKGMQAAVGRRYAVPTQKPWVASPSREVAIA